MADGPFRFVRNPLYLAGIPLSVGMGMMASRLGWFVLVIGMWIFHYRLILYEEDALLRTQAESYRAYCKAVPRLFPSLTPRLPSSGREPRWAQAFLGELFIWLFGAALLFFAITLRMKPAMVLVAVSLAFYMIMSFAVKRRGDRSDA